MSSEQGKLDIRDLMLDVAAGVVSAFQAMTSAAEVLFKAWNNVSGLMKGIEFLHADAKVADYQERADSIRRQLAAGGDTSIMGGEGGIGAAVPFSTDELAAKRQELAELETYLKALRQYQEQTAAAFGDVTMPGEQTAADKVFERLQSSLSGMRGKLDAGGAAPGSTTSTATAAGGGLPEATRYLSDTGEDSRIEAEAQAGADKTLDAVLQDWNEQQQKASAEAIRIRANLVDQTKSLTLSQADYQRWALDEEIKGLREYAAASDASADQVASYKKAKLAEIAQAEAESARRVQEQIEELQQQMTQPEAGRFQQERTTVQTEYVRRNRDIDDQVRDQQITPDQETELRTWTDKWRDNRLGEIGQRAGDDYAAGWSRGMDDVLDNMQSGFERAESLAKETASAMSDSFGDFFFDVMQGKLESLSDYLKSFLTSIQRAISNVMGQMATQAVMSSMSGVNFSSLFAANGAVWEGGFTPVKQFASGGVVSSPTLGVVGEGRYTEAIVPLPDGRSIPAKITGGQGQTVNVQVNVLNQSSTPVQASAGATQYDGSLKAWVIEVVLEDLSTNQHGLRSAIAGA